MHEWNDDGICTVCGEDIEWVYGPFQVDETQEEYDARILEFGQPLPFD